MRAKYSNDIPKLAKEKIYSYYVELKLFSEKTNELFARAVDI